MAKRGRGKAKPTWGIANGINTDETMKTYRKVDARTQGVSRKFLLNAVWTQSRRARMPDNDDDPTCTCGTEEENPTASLVAVPAMGGHPRETLSEYVYDNLPVATRGLGILPSNVLAPTENIHGMMFDIFVQRYGSIAS